MAAIDGSVVTRWAVQAAAVLCLFLPAPVWAAGGADCTKAKTPDEKVICASPALGRVDREMAASYRGLLQAVVALGPAAEQRLKEGQRGWVAGRGAACGLARDVEVTAETRPAFTECLAELYAARARELEGIRAGLPLSAAIAAIAVTESVAQQHYEIDARYPQIADAGIAGADGFNRRIKEQVTELIGQSQREFAEMAADPPDSDGAGPESGSSLWLRYDVFFPSQRLISVRFEISTYFAGAAHPNTQYSSITFDLAGGRQLTLADLVGPGDDWQGVIARHCLSELKRVSEQHDIGFLPDDASAAVSETVADFTNWSIAAGRAIITFNAYSVFSYAAGPQEVEVPFALLKPYLRADAPVPLK